MFWDFKRDSPKARKFPVRGACEKILGCWSRIFSCITCGRLAYLQRKLGNARGFTVFVLLAGLVMFVMTYFIFGQAKQLYSGINLDAIKLDPGNPHPIHRRIVHIDLKGLPPRSRYLNQLLPFLKEQGATGILLEWEDMLPFYGDLELLRSPNVYKPDQVKSVLATANQLGLEVIPLVQTFGHMESVLKHREMSFLREVSDDMRVMCPSHGKAVPTLTALMDQVFHFHPNIRTIHLGTNDINIIQQCSKCRSTGMTPAELYLFHMLPLIQHANGKGVNVMLWDDFLRDWPLVHLETLAEENVEIVVWNSHPNLGVHIPLPGEAEYNPYMPQPARPTILRNIVWNNYQAVFPGRVWGASSFRGADRMDGDFVPLGTRVQNHVNWLKMSLNTRLTGMILAGPARKSHLHPLTESLPAAIPSITMGLQIFKTGIDSPEERNATLKILGVTDLPHFDPQQPVPSFPGAEIYRFAEELHLVKNMHLHDQLVKTDSQKSKYSAFQAHFLHIMQGSGTGNYGGPTSIREHLDALSANVMKAIHRLAGEAELLLPSVFYPTDIGELIATKLGIEIRDAMNLDVTKTFDQLSPAPRAHQASTVYFVFSMSAIICVIMSIMF